VQKHILGEVRNRTAIWWQVASKIFVPKIIKIWQLVFKLQSKMSGSQFFWDTVYIYIYIYIYTCSHMHIGSRFIHIRYWQCRMHIGSFLSQYPHYWLLHPEPYEIGFSTSKEYLQRPNMMVVVIYVYIRVYTERIMTVASLLVFCIQKQYDDNGYVAI